MTRKQLDIELWSLVGTGNSDQLRTLYWEFIGKPKRKPRLKLVEISPKAFTLQQYREISLPQQYG